MCTAMLSRLKENESELVSSLYSARQSKAKGEKMLNMSESLGLPYIPGSIGIQVLVFLDMINFLMLRDEPDLELLFQSDGSVICLGDPAKMSKFAKVTYPGDISDLLNGKNFIVNRNDINRKRIDLKTKNMLSIEYTHEAMLLYYTMDGISIETLSFDFINPKDYNKNTRACVAKYYECLDGFNNTDATVHVDLTKNLVPKHEIVSLNEIDETDGKTYCRIKIPTPYIPAWYKLASIKWFRTVVNKILDKIWITGTTEDTYLQIYCIALAVRLTTPID